MNERKIETFQFDASFKLFVLILKMNKTLDTVDFV